ncbi:MAG: PilN domain-containing protein [Candidatus Rokubacteria bacterium]|nr:PilN domain-containing protein [Candidatus Rokubacteria bacterium]
MIKINLLPARPRKRFAITLPTLPGLGLIFGLLYLLIIGGVGGYWFLLNQESRTLTAEIARIEKETAQHKAAIAEGNRFKKEKEELERRVALIDAISRNQTRPIYLLDALADTVPGDVWLTLMEEKEKVLKIAGSAFSATAVADFMANLKGSGKFKDVDLVVSRQDLTKTPRVVTFELTCRLDI